MPNDWLGPLRNYITTAVCFQTSTTGFWLKIAAIVTCCCFLRCFRQSAENYKRIVIQSNSLWHPMPIVPPFARPIPSVCLSMTSWSTAKMVRSVYGYYGEPVGSHHQATRGPVSNPFRPLLPTKLGDHNLQSKPTSQIAAKRCQIQRHCIDSLCEHNITLPNSTQRG